MHCLWNEVLLGQHYILFSIWAEYYYAWKASKQASLENKSCLWSQRERERQRQRDSETEGETEKETKRERKK